MIILSKENLELARFEVQELLGKRVRFIDEYGFPEYSQKLKNLAYTKRVLKVLFSCPEKKLVEKMSNYEWKKVYKKSFSIKIPQKTSLEKEMASYVWYQLKNPKVNLKKSETPIEIYFAKKKAYVCLFIQENTGFEERKAHKRIAPHPSSLHPKLARAMINMLGSCKTVYDSFCGSGGTMIEGGLVGKKMIGYEIDPIMIKRAQKNLKQFSIRNYKIEQKDAIKTKRMNYFVADLPYGRNTKGKDVENLYKKFFENLHFKKAVVGFPDFVNYKKILPKGVKVKKTFDYYLHKNLKKKIVILEQ